MNQKSFYVTLPSTSSRTEYPSNNASDFKVRLPRPLLLGKDEWEVTMASLSLPDTVIPLPSYFTRPLFMLKWSSLNGFAMSGYNQTLTHSQIKAVFKGANGVSLMKSMVDYFEIERANYGVRSQGSSFVDSNGKRLHVKFKWEDTELVIDNKDTKKTNTNDLYIKIDSTLCEKMGWFTKETNGTWSLGANLKREYFDDTVPNPPVSQRDVHNTAQELGFWKEQAGFIQLSSWCNWRFINLNKAFQEMVCNPVNMLFVNTNLGDPVIVGNQWTSKLCKVEYKRKCKGDVFIEPEERQYISLRNNDIDIIHVQLASKEGNLYDFENGTTSLSLHFRKKQ